MDYPSWYGWRGQREDRKRTARYSCSTVVGHVIVNRKTRVQTRLDHQSGTKNDILVGEDKYLCFSILFHNTQLLALIVIKMWENWGGGNCNRFPIQTRIFSKERVGEGGPFHLLPWRWSETERRGSVQRHLLLPLGIQGPVHLHTLVHETCYFNVLASRFNFEYCEYLRCSQPWASDAEALGLNLTPVQS